MGRPYNIQLFANKVVFDHKSMIFKRVWRSCPELMKMIDAQYLETPYYGSRQMARYLRREGYNVGRHRVCRLMKLMGIDSKIPSLMTL